MMTVDSLAQQFATEFPTMTPRQQGAFRGNLTWLIGKTTDAAALQRLYTLQSAAQAKPHLRTTAVQPVAEIFGTSLAAVSEASQPVKRYSVYQTRLKLERSPLAIAENPAIGEHAGHPERVARLASQLIGSEAQEHLLVFLLDVRNVITGVQTVHVGTTSQCVIKVADILRVALLGNASSVILAHNHPSGNVTPSPEDESATREVWRAGQILDIAVLDHLVVSDDPSQFTSLAITRKYLFRP